VAIDDAGIARVVGAAVDDIVATLGWTREEAERFVMTEGCVAAYARDSQELLTLAYQVMTNVQEAIQEQRIDTSWPVCLQHGRHPLSFEHDLVWRCPQIDYDDPKGFMRGVPFGWLNTVWPTPE
jgi:hypothetical protein